MKKKSLLELNNVKMENFTGQKFRLFLKDWTSVIKLKNSNGNAP